MNFIEELLSVEKATFISKRRLILKWRVSVKMSGMNVGEQVNVLAEGTSGRLSSICVNDSLICYI